GDVLQGETGPAVAFFGDADLDPRHLSAELPGGGETVRRVALFDGARGVAFQAVVAPRAEVTADGQEPAGDPLRVRDRVPQVGGVGRVHPAGGQHPSLTRLQCPGADGAGHFRDVVGDVERHVFF